MICVAVCSVSFSEQLPLRGDLALAHEMNLDDEEDEI